MTNQTIICRTIGEYTNNLTRGKSYQVIEINGEKELIRIICDLGRHRWFPQYYFNLDGTGVVSFISWTFDDEVTVDPTVTNWIEISLEMSDGSKRWCMLYTPERLLNVFKQPNIDPPGMHLKHMIIVRSYTVGDVQWTLTSLEQQDELMKATLSC
ncbi:hypothetical protein [Sporosarcina limicola]|uniref:Uncharacterized protein n=1 Tax=Sporosarcina limicola TaxID=34101 RepID=A0A927R4N2_9BACL|nr:hypothetical protein [Sporosarcina limicola]MBE1553064.1 hypothetical protein [Sporosarcina limicola]